MAIPMGMPDNVVSQFSEKQLSAYLNSITDEKKKQEHTESFFADLFCDIDKYSNQDVLDLEKLFSKYEARISSVKKSEFNEILINKLRNIVKTFSDGTKKPEKPRFLYINP